MTPRRSISSLRGRALEILGLNQVCLQMSEADDQARAIVGIPGELPREPSVSAEWSCDSHVVPASPRSSCDP